MQFDLSSFQGHTTVRSTKTCARKIWKKIVRQIWQFQTAELRYRRQYVLEKTKHRWKTCAGSLSPGGFFVLKSVRKLSIHPVIARWQMTRKAEKICRGGLRRTNQFCFSIYEQYSTCHLKCYFKLFRIMFLWNRSVVLTNNSETSCFSPELRKQKPIRNTAANGSTQIQ